MARPQPESFPNWWQYHQAKKGWKRSTGGSLIGTFLLCAFVGALTGSAAVLLILVVGGLALHLAVRAGAFERPPSEQELDGLEKAVRDARARSVGDDPQLLHAERILAAHRPQR